MIIHRRKDEDVGSAKHLMMEREDDLAMATSFLLRIKVLQKCPVHEDQIWEGREDIQSAYPIANSMISSGKLKLRGGLSRAEFSALLKDAFDNCAMAEGCYYCLKD